ncbi:MAG TPA: ABC transporter permease [candidate division Zixibacteria bacterium]|nr:ABC transporter permease [candidate division Zixibacteria bacterium]
MIFKLAWRNLFRNKRRTIIAGIAIAIGLGALIFLDAIYTGEEVLLPQIATSTFLGEAQITHEQYRVRQTVDLTIQDFDETLGMLAENPYVEAFTARAQAFGTISSARDVRGISIYGIVPETERKMSILDEVMVEGEYLTGDNTRDAIIGTKLAEILGVSLGDRIVLSAAQAISGDIAQELFRVSGIFDFGDRSMNSGTVFIGLDVAQRLLGIGETAHTIVLKFLDTNYSRDTTTAFWSDFSKGGNVAVSWVQIMPEIATIDEMMLIGKISMSVILMGVVIFVILNTLFMALYERMFELGVLRALGTRPIGVAKLLMFEAGALSIVGIVFGVTLGFTITALMTHIGFDFSGMEFSGIALREKLYPVMKLYQFIIYPVGVFIFTLIVGIYPAVHAARIAPSKAMRKTM